jgi:acyl CoA:acetate/3-ketoacid CoA transferase alpha subunit
MVAINSMARIAMAGWCAIVTVEAIVTTITPIPSGAVRLRQRTQCGGGKD